MLLEEQAQKQQPMSPDTPNEKSDLKEKNANVAVVGDSTMGHSEEAAAKVVTEILSDVMNRMETLPATTTRASTAPLEEEQRNANATHPTGTTEEQQQQEKTISSIIVSEERKRTYRAPAAPPVVVNTTSSSSSSVVITTEITSDNKTHRHQDSKRPIFMTSKEFWSSRKSGDDTTNSMDKKNIVYQCIVAKSPTEYAYDELKNIPITYAMDLSNYRQQQQAMSLLGMENEQFRRRLKMKEARKLKANGGMPKGVGGVKQKNAPTLKIKSQSAPSPGVNPAARKRIKLVESAPLVYEGPPDEKGVDWPPGWIKRSYSRAGHPERVDRYWYPPEGGRRLRSILEVKKHLLKGTQSDVV